MQEPVQISFRHMETMPWLHDEILNHADDLDRVFDGIISCRIVVEMPHRHHRKGNHCQMRLSLTVPGKELIINRESAHHAENEDIRAVLRDTFQSAKRQLEDYIRIKRGQVKAHAHKVEAPIDI